MNLSGKRVVVMGLGGFGGGAGVTRFLVQAGADVLVTDQSPQDKLQQAVDSLSDLSIDYRLGEHRASDFAEADIVVANPAVKPGPNPYLDAARAAGAELTSEIRLLAGQLPNRGHVIGITGTAGKSTVTAMVGHALRQALGDDAVHVGGNLGGSLLESVDAIKPDHWVVLELSSFMLVGLDAAQWSPAIAAVTNLSPNHLDWHGTFDAYRAAKQAMFDHQLPGDTAVLGPGMGEHFTPRCDTSVCFAPLSELEAQCRARPTPLLIAGVHNQVNAQVAARIAALTGAFGAPSDADATMASALEAITDFPGLPHRLQLICEREDVSYVNDSKSTTPGAAQLAIESFDSGTVHAILGGFDKGSDLTTLARTAAGRCRAVYTVGATGDRIADAIEAAADGMLTVEAVHGPSGAATSCGGVDWGEDPEGASPEVVRAGTVEAAVRATASRVHRGDVVLLSPGCASWDQFTNYEARARTFTEAVLRYTGEGAPPPRRVSSSDREPC